MNESDNTNEEQIKMGGGATNFKPWLFRKGQSGNLNGRPKGSKNLKNFAKEYLESLPDEDKLDFLDGLPKDILWRMAEGQPHQTTDMDVKGVLKIEFAKEFNKSIPEQGK